MHKKNVNTIFSNKYKLLATFACVSSVFCAVNLTELQPAHACRPGRPPATLSERVQQTPVVFEGVVDRVNEDRLTIRVNRYFKGNGPKVVSLKGFNQTSCDDIIQKSGGRYVFFASGEPVQPWTAVYDSAYGSLRPYSAEIVGQLEQLTSSSSVNSKLVGTWRFRQRGAGSDTIMKINPDDNVYFINDRGDFDLSLVFPFKYRLPNTTAKPMQIDIWNDIIKQSQPGIFEFISDREFRWEQPLPYGSRPKRFTRNAVRVTRYDPQAKPLPSNPDLEARAYLGQLVENELFYHLEKNRFSGGSGKALIETRNYTYQITPDFKDQNQTRITAIPKSNNLKSYTAALFRYQHINAKGQQEGSPFLIAGICRSQSNTQVAPVVSASQRFNMDKQKFGLQCPSGSNPLF